MTILYILLAIIAYYIYRIYRQKEDEKGAIYNEKLDVEHEQARKEKFKDYPHLYGKLEGNWLDVFAHHAENDLPLLNLAFMLYLGESTKIDFSEGSQSWDTLWDLTEELLEDLEKNHKGTTAEHLIAVCTYWQIAAEAMGKLVEENPNTGSLSSGAHTSEVAGEKLEVPPFTDIKKILSLFPKKATHPTKELLFTDEKGNFPRKSEGSKLIHDRITV
ncbi:MAG: hypothetical protein Q8P01_00885 [bacterium]|nr:hypothetical protein [bacterium]